MTRFRSQDAYPEWPRSKHPPATSTATASTPEVSKTKLEATRCLKRQISKTVWRILIDEATPAIAAA